MAKELLTKVNPSNTLISFSTIIDAITQAIKQSNVKVVYNYPGRPATALADNIKKVFPEIDVQDYLTNEFVAAAKGFGSSVAGCERSLVIFKDVGVNVACDHFYCMNHIGTNRGLVFFISDDPSAWHSQNEEDSRGIYFNAGLPILEPYDQYSAYYSVLIAYELSEMLRLPFFIRTTGRSLTETFKPEANDLKNVNLPFVKDFVDIPFDAKNKWLSIFGSVEEDREDLAKKQNELKKWFNKLEVNIIKGSGNLGVIASGFPATQLENENLVNNMSLLKLLTVYPLPEELILNFLKDKERVLVIDQGEPLLEMLTRDLAHRHGLNKQIAGKLNGYVRSIGEFRDDDLKIAINAFKNNTPVYNFPRHKQIAKAPAFKEDDGFRILVECVRDAVKETGCRPLYCSDAGQASRIPETPEIENLLHMETTMGCAISYLAGGIEAYKRRGEDIPFKGIAYIGDSDFFHSAFPGICEAVAKDLPMLMLLVDNQGAVSTGKQAHFGMKINNQIKQLSIKKILQALDVSSLEEASIVDKKDLALKLVKGLKHNGFAVLIVHTE